MENHMSGTSFPNGLPPMSIDSRLGVDFQRRESLSVNQQTIVNKVATVNSQVKAQDTGRISEEVSPVVSGKFHSADMENLGQSSEARNVKEQLQKTIYALIKMSISICKSVSSLNPLIFFNKNKDKASAVQQKANVTDVQPTFVKATPEQLSTAAKKLSEFMLNKPEIFENVGIFRISSKQENNIKLFNKLMASPEGTDLNGVHPHVLAAILKQIYRDMNLFGGELTSKLEETGNKLSETSNEQEIISLLKDLKNNLSIENQEDLKTYIQVLAKAGQKAEINKMDILNLAIIGGPNLCNSSNLSIIEPRKEVAYQLIIHHEEVFGKELKLS
jgi:hypothetical protein